MATATSNVSVMPREHGATAMLLIPAFCAAILARQWRWTELWTLGAAISVFAAKDWLIVLARQRWVWQDLHPETARARQVLVSDGFLFAGCSLYLLRIWPLWALLASAVGVAAFMTMTVVITIRNRQRSTLFQVASALTLSATSLAMCLSATGKIQPWCWWLWLLNSAQATAGILVVHSRLERRIAARKGVEKAKWGPAHTACIVLLLGSLFARDWWIFTALLLAASGYFYELRRQENPESLQMPLTHVGLQALGLSIVYATLVIAGLWPY